ncbi:MAG: transcriptional regulator [Acidimicrobiales bacterium]|nr:MAG: transcriptional regulator [Acidimicrobiales bacterium]
MSVATDDELWFAIGDPTRRHMIDLLVEDGRGTASSLSSALPVSRQAVAKHLAVLERVELVRSTRDGRERVYQPGHAQLARAAKQLAAVGSAWDRRLARIARIAEDIERQKRSTTTKTTRESREGSP